MDEVIDILDENTGKRTGQTISKNIAHANGTWHGAIHILIINKDKTKALFQKRCPGKTIYPNTWDIAVGGHISAGEDASLSAKRELKEELGLDIENYSIEELPPVKESLKYNDLNSNEFVTTYIIYADIDLNELTLQKEEVSDVKWLTKKEINELVNTSQTIPHVIAFKILDEVLV